MKAQKCSYIILNQRETLETLVLYRGTSKCDHKKYYLGNDDKFLRVSAIGENGNRRNTDSPIHFVAYDYLFEYHASVLSGGSTQIAFLQCKNDINVNIRGLETETSRQVFRKAYEIFIHALKYDAEQGWSCGLCPQPLNTKAGEKEDDFTDEEVHISDGINMGTIENEIKGYATPDIFEEG